MRRCVPLAGLGERRLSSEFRLRERFDARHVCFRIVESPCAAQLIHSAQAHHDSPVFLPPPLSTASSLSLTMSTLCPDGVLPGRPDIEGIGTRVATYAQLLLAVFVIVFSPASSWFGSWWALLVTSLGLQLAAVASRNTITLLHALVVTWLAFPIFAMSWVYIFAHWRIDSMPSEVWLLTHLHGLVFVG